MIVTSFQEEICMLTDHVKHLEAKTDLLLAKEMNSKRLKIVAEILSPLKKSSFRDMSTTNLP